MVLDWCDLCSGPLPSRCCGGSHTIVSLSDTQLKYVRSFICQPPRLSWADTAASTFGRLYGHLTPRLPLHLLGLPVATRKSLAGLIGSFATTALTTLVFWGFCTRGMGAELGDAVWQWSQLRTGGWLGIAILSVGAGAVTSIAEVLGEALP